MEIEADSVANRDGIECLKYMENMYKNSEHIMKLSDIGNIYSHNNIIARNDNSASLDN